MTKSPNFQKEVDPANIQSGSEKSVPADELLTIAEIAAYLKISRRTAWRWCKSGRLPAGKVGHQWRVARSALEKFVHQGGI